MYAVMMSGGKQYTVSEGDLVRIEDLGLESGSEVEFKEVLLVKTDEGAHIGQPLVEGAVVQGIVEKVGRGDTVLVFKYRKKKQYRRTRGHRQNFCDVRIGKIALS
ncbi:MAG: 50S ribosomal protein L21 [Acidobacteria bacterium]|nr:50S ribosomal protein L21 [Acidobacteriota bacterium]